MDFLSIPPSHPNLRSGSRSPALLLRTGARQVRSRRHASLL